MTDFQFGRKEPISTFGLAKMAPMRFGSNPAALRSHVPGSETVPPHLECLVAVGDEMVDCSAEKLDPGTKIGLDIRQAKTERAVRPAWQAAHGGPVNSN